MHPKTYISPFAIRILPFCLCLTLLLPAHPAHAQTRRTYTTADGLPSNNIQALAYQEDPLDFPPCNPPECTDPPVIPGLWVGTESITRIGFTICSFLLLWLAFLHDHRFPQSVFEKSKSSGNAA